MPAEDHIFDDFPDDLDDVYAVLTSVDRAGGGRYAPHVKTCNRCGEGKLLWGHDGRSWYLTDAEGYAHECNEAGLHRAIADDFEILPEQP